MELGTTIIGLAMTALCIIPFVLLTKGRRNKEKELFNALQSIANWVSSEVATFDCGLEFAIGMSKDNKHVFFYKKWNERITETTISLDTVIRCHIQTDRKTIKSNDTSETIIDKLVLVFEPKKNHEVVRLEFYCSKEHYMITDELKLIKKWETLITDQLTK